MLFSQIGTDQTSEKCEFSRKRDGHKTEQNKRFVAGPIFSVYIVATVMPEGKKHWGASSNRWG